MAKQLQQFLVTLEVDGDLTPNEAGYIASQLNEAALHWRNECGLTSDDSEATTYVIGVVHAPGLIDAALAVVDGDGAELQTDLAALAQALIAAGFGD